MVAGQCIGVPIGVAADNPPTSACPRVRSNVLRARVLLILFLVLAAPLVAFIASYLSLWIMIYLAPGFFHGERALLMQAFSATILLALLAGHLALASRTLPRRVGARPLPRSDGVVAWRRLDALAGASRVPTPGLHLHASIVPNAFSAGWEQKQAGIVVTRGLLERLSLRELDGVLTHELVHIANQDTRLSSMAAAIFRTAKIPALLAWIALLVVGAAALVAHGDLRRVEVLWSTHYKELFARAAGDHVQELAATMASTANITLAAGLVAFLLWPAIAWLLRRTLVSRNETDVDAQAVAVTGDPLALACALAKMSGGSAGQVDEEEGEDGSRLPGCRPWPRGGAWRKDTPSWKISCCDRLKHSCGIGHACFAPLAGRVFRKSAKPEVRIAALRRMAPNESFDVSVELPEPGFISVATESVRVEPVEDLSVFSAFGAGLLFGWLASTVIFDMRLVQLWVESPYMNTLSLSGDLRSAAAANIFGVSGAVAAFAALYRRRRLSWWPVLVMLMFGQYIPLLTLKQLSGPLPMSSYSVLVAYLASLTEPAAGAALGAIANRRLIPRFRRREAEA